MLLQEPRYDVRPECKRYPAVVFAPPCDVLVGIRPQQVAQETAVGNLPRLASFRSELGKNIFFFFFSRTSVGRITRRICSIEFRSGLRPPCMVKIFSSIMAAIGRQLKQSVNVFHSLMLYRRLHSS